MVCAQNAKGEVIVHGEVMAEAESGRWLTLYILLAKGNMYSSLLRKFESKE
jgi:hypothetical protein